MVLLDYAAIQKNILTHTFKIFEGENKKEILGSELSKKRQDFILKCVEQACRGCLTHRHGAVIVSDGKVIAEGFNKDYVNPIKRRDNYGIHAEVNAILSTMYLPKDSILYVVRLKTEDRKVIALNNSDPCHNCRRMCTKNKIKKIYAS